jgi:hypothetical protein
MVLDHTPSTSVSIAEHSAAKFLRVGPTGGAHRLIKIIWSCQSDAGCYQGNDDGEVSYFDHFQLRYLSKGSRFDCRIIAHSGQSADTATRSFMTPSITLLRDFAVTQNGQCADIPEVGCGSLAHNYDTTVISLGKGRITHEGCRAGSGLLAFRHRPGLRSGERAAFFGEHAAIAALVARSTGLPI